MENRKYSPEWRGPGRREPFPDNNQGNKPAEKSRESEGDKKSIQNFRDLKIWQLGKEIVVETYKITRFFPNEELYGLTTQMRRAAVSIPSNVSEGHSRRATKDYQRFLNIAAGSCAELETQMEIALELGYLKTASRESVMEKIDHERRMLRKLISKLSESAIPHPPSAIQEKTRAPSPLRY